LNRLEDLLDRYFAGQVSDAERLEVLQLLQSGSIEEPVKKRVAKSLTDQLRAGARPDAKLVNKGEEIFHSIQRSVELPHVNPAQNTRSRRMYRAVISYAAVFAILILAGVFTYSWNNEPRKQVVQHVESIAPKKVTINNSGKSPQRVLLQDGSTVTLEPGGELTYQEPFVTSREVSLTGEAFFEVEKDPEHPFYVHANEVTTKVLGTSFRVKANQGEKEIVVAVKTGKVSVFASPSNKNTSSSNLEEVTLTPNQQAIYRRAEQVVVKKVVDVPEVLNIQATRKDSYVNEPVVRILEELSQTYGVDIRFDRAALSNCTLTSDIIEGEGLYEQLEIVCNALGGTYQMRNDASIVIEANGCRSMNVKP
jgi:ferric-dicitrate binding protein FerR (iron transport regulator)